MEPYFWPQKNGVKKRRERPKQKHPSTPRNQTITHIHTHTQRSLQTENRNLEEKNTQERDTRSAKPKKKQKQKNTEKKPKKNRNKNTYRKKTHALLQRRTHCSTPPPRQPFTDILWTPFFLFRVNWMISWWRNDVPQKALTVAFGVFVGNL